MYLPLARFSGDLWSMTASKNINSLHIRKLAHDGNLTLLLDGLNECRPSLLEACVFQIKNLLAEFSKLKLILTSRTQHYKNFLQIPAFSLLPMSEDQQSIFLQRRVVTSANASAILNQIRQKPSGKELASNPSFLKLVAETFSGTEEISFSLGKLHLRLLEQWYKREQQKKGVLGKTTPLAWNFYRVKALITELAFSSRLAGQFSEVKYEWARDFFNAKLGNQSISFLDFISQSVLFGFSDDSDYLRFAHESIQETLAADFLLRHPKLWEETMESPENWRMVASHVVTSEEQIDEHLVMWLERIEPWIAVCARPWDPSPIDKIDWASQNNWLDGACAHTINFAMRNGEWQRSAKNYLFDKSRNTSQLISYIEKRILSAEDFRGEEWDKKLKNWFINNTTSTFARDIFTPDRILRIVSTCEIFEAVDLYKKGLFRKLDINNLLETWKSSATLGKAAAMIRDNDLLTWSDFIVRRVEWIKGATPTQAYKWVKAGLMNWSEFEAVGISEKSYLTTSQPVSTITTAGPNYYYPSEVSQEQVLEYAFKHQIAVPALVESIRIGGYGVLVCGQTAYLPKAKSGFPFGGSEMLGRKIDVLLWEMKVEPLVIWANYQKNYQKIQQANGNKLPVKGQIVKKIIGGYGVDCDGIWTFLPDKHMPVHLALDFSNELSDDNNIGEIHDFFVDDIDLPKKDTNKSIQVSLADTSDDVDYFLSMEALYSEFLAESPVEGIICATSDHEIKISFGLSISSSLKISGLAKKNDMSFVDSLKLGTRVSCLIRNVSFFSGKIIIDVTNRTKPVDEKYQSIAANGFDLEVDKLFKGVIKNVTSRGYIVEIAYGIQGLLQKSEMPKFVRQDILRINDAVEVVVCESKISSGEIILKIANSFFSHIFSGSKFIGLIYKIADYGLFIEIESNITGLLHKNHFSQEMRVRKYRVGDKIQVEVKSIDLVKGEISLTLPRQRFGIGHP